MFELFIYGGLFVVLMVVVILFLFQFEVVFVGLLFVGCEFVWVLVLVVSVGNVVGLVINWVFGCGIEYFCECCWFLVKLFVFVCVECWYVCYGCWLLLLSWVLVIGDLLMIIVGVLCELLLIFFVIVMIVKVGCYLVVVWFVMY